MKSLRNGREAFKNSFYPVAVTYLTKAQTLLKENHLEVTSRPVLTTTHDNHGRNIGVVFSGYAGLRSVQSVFKLRYLRGEGLQRRV